MFRFMFVGVVLVIAASSPEIKQSPLEQRYTGLAGPRCFQSDLKPSVARPLGARPHNGPVFTHPASFRLFNIEHRRTSNVGIVFLRYRG